jgi:hypothetical protein
MMQNRWNNIGDKNGLLCMNGYTYVMTLIMDKMWRKPLEHFF